MPGAEIAAIAKVAATAAHTPVTVSQRRRWPSVAGAWLGIGTAPGALLLGAGISARHGGPVPVLSLVLSAGVMFTILWFQGRLGLIPPWGDGGNLTQVAPRYFGPGMQRLVGALIAVGMTGWAGFNVGLGASALAALLRWPQWAAVLALGGPIAALSLGGIKGWNGLATLTTISVLALVGAVVARFAAPVSPVTWDVGRPIDTAMDLAVFVGYIAVFTVRAPDFTAGLGTRADLGVVGLLLCVPLMLVAVAGVVLQQGTGSADLVHILAGPGGLAIGNLLITLAVIAPTFTCFYSGVPGLRAATGLGEVAAIVMIAAVGLALAIARFDLWLLSWLGILGAMLPPLVLPLAVESTRRRMGKRPRRVPVSVWAISAAVSLGLTLARHPLALLAGLATAAVATGVWYLFWHEPTSDTALSP